MKTARQSDAVTWWAMGRTARARYGYEHAREMSQDIITEGNRRLFMAGANGDPRPRDPRRARPQESAEDAMTRRRYAGTPESRDPH
jgi:hypothetical protein